ncbi:MAG: hypothetical protein ACKV2Q_15140 [Planctomycetaceae bacterium]
MSYWDTSSLAKLYLVEPDSATFDALGGRATSIRISPLVRLESNLLRRSSYWNLGSNRYFKPA